ncbi:MAG: hypothetical protein JKX85_07595, partial [Phycisphaeraceae bacterium]|nr:hypothetical protein [Phycisphaeraceae bacterium]
NIIKITSLPVTARWITQNASDPSLTVKHGQGAPVVEVVLRKKSDREVFAFVLNQGGEGTGMVECYLPTSLSSWQVRDAITGQTLEASQTSKGVRLPMALKAWDYRVLQLTQ